jgi:O-antigen/teichoic acid export membrane protein
MTPMTVTAPRTRGYGHATGRLAPVPSTAPGRRPPGRWRRWSAAHPAWPVTALLVGYPVWWALGLGDLSVIIIAVPMALRMRAWRRGGRPVRVPPAFGLWLLFLVVAAAGIVTLGLTAPGTVVSPLSNRLLAFVDRDLTYLALTVILLFTGNLTEAELPRRRLAWQLGLVGIYATVGGLAGVVMPGFKFTSPMAYLLPHGMQQNNLVQAALYPGFSQVTDVLGIIHGRPKAPFEYTNTWGNCLTILLPWLLVAWWSYGSKRQRKWALIVVAAALIPLVYSLNRTVWVAVALTAVYVAVRLAARGRLAMLGVVLAGLALVTVTVAATPLQGLITSRLQHQQSNSIRGSLALAAIADANAAPVIGFGDTRHQQGSASSIAVGPTADCPSCGQFPVGSNGQLYLLLVCNGWVGTGLFLSFFAYLAWRYRRDRTPYGMAGVLVILLSFLYMFAYVSVTAALEFTMFSVALLWRNDQWLRQASQVPPGPQLPPAPQVPSRPRVPSRPQVTTPRHVPARLQAARAHGAWPSRAVSHRPPSRAVSHRPATPAAAPAPIPAPAPVPAPAAASAPARGADRPLAGVARGGVLNLVGAAVGGLATVALTLVVTRTFSQAAAGAFFTAMSLFLIVEAVASLGSATGTTYFIARLRALDQPRRIPEVLRAAVRPVAAVSVVAGVALVLLASPAAGFLTDSLGHPGARPAEVAAGLRALAVALPFAALLDTLLGATRGYRAMGPTNVVDRIGRPLLQLAGVAAAAAAGSAALLAPLWALAYLPAVVVVWFWLRRIRCRLILDIPAPPEPLRFWRFTGPRGLAALAQITIQRIDIVLVAVMRGPAQAAVYTAATRFLVAGQFGNQAISMAAQPRFTEMFTRGDHQAANRVYQATTAWLVVLTWPLYLLAVAFGPQVIAVFGRSYSAGAAVMVILGLTMLLATACGQVDMVLVTTGRSSWSLLNGLLAVGVNVGLDLILIPRYGIVGAAAGWSAAIVLTNLLPLAQIAVVEGLHPFGRGTAIAVVLSACSFGLLPLGARALAGHATGHATVASLAAIACGGVVMAAGLWRFRAELNLSAMPGAARLAALRRHRRTQPYPVEPTV